MNLFDVYPLFDVEIVRGEGCHVYDSKGTEYLDLYGGHAVISVGHSHPHYVDAIKRQAEKLVFYSTLSTTRCRCAWLRNSARRADTTTTASS